MRSFYLFAFGIFLLGCKKTTTNCEAIQNAYASSNSPVTIGDTLKIHTQEVGGYRLYSWTGPNHFTSQYPRNVIVDAQLEHEGWYYLALSNGECNTRVDSVYVDIKLLQGTPACSITSNTCQFNNLFDDSYSVIRTLVDPSFQFFTLRGSGTGSTLNINFHPRWKTTEPEDGIYETVGVASFSSVDGNYNKVFINTVKSSVYFSSHENQKVYVSHVNGKLQVRFCNISMGGYNGTSFITLASGNLIQQ